MNLFTYIPHDGDATAFYRATQPLAQLRRIMPHLNIEHSGNVISPKTLAHIDVCFIQRPDQGAHIALMELCQEYGIKTWIDYDDNFFCVPSDNPASAYYKKPENQTIVKRILKEADLVTVSTRQLAEDLDEIVNRMKGYHVVPNAFNDYLFKENPQFGNNNLVFWRGTQSHQKDLSDLATQIISVSKDHLAPFVFMGYEPWFLKSDMPARTKFIEPMDIMKYHRFIRTLAPRIMIAPLSESRFNRCKSNIAWIEATLSGAAILAPSWEEWNRPGVSFYSNQDQFKQQLTNLLTGKIDELNKLHSQSWDYISQNLLLSEINQKRKRLLEQLL